jgi:hypothetical protein
MLKLGDACLRIAGDGVTDPDLLVLVRLVHRGMLD